MNIAQEARKLLRNKKMLFTGFAAIGGLVSGMLVLTVPFIMNNTFLSWTIPGAFDAALIGAMAVYAQNYYQTKSFKLPLGLKRAVTAGLVIGAAGGVCSYFVVMTFGGGEFGRFVGWALSGGVAGYVVSEQVPNLKQKTAIVAGAVGGFLGCLIMEIDFGYTIGVGVTGAAIGFIVATAEVIFRKNWVDVEIYAEKLGSGICLAKPIREFALGLGLEPITLGSREDMTIRLMPGSGSANGHSASIYFENDKAIFHDLSSDAKTELKANSPFRFCECQMRLGA